MIPAPLCIPQTHSLHSRPPMSSLALPLYRYYRYFDRLFSIIAALFTFPPSSPSTPFLAQHVPHLTLYRTTQVKYIVLAYLLCPIMCWKARVCIYKRNTFVRAETWHLMAVANKVSCDAPLRSQGSVKRKGDLPSLRTRHLHAIRTRTRYL